MHSELVDTLRCLSVHEESWLVAAADETEGRHIVRGLLGCPVCHARYPIAHGIADFSGGARAPVALDDGDASSGEDAAIRLAAMLDLTDSSGYVILVGSWARLGAALREVVPVMVLAVNPHPDAEIGDGVSGVTTLDRIPVAASSARACVSSSANLARAVTSAASVNGICRLARCMASRSATPMPNADSTLASG